LIGADGFHIAHATGVRSSTDGITWTDDPITDRGLYDPHLAVVDGALLVSEATGDLWVHDGTDGTWADHTVDGLSTFHWIKNIGGKLVAMAAMRRADANGEYLTQVDVDAADASGLVEDESMAPLFEIPAGVLLADGSLARSAADLTNREAHTDPF